MDGLVFALDKQKRIIKMLKLDNGDYDQYLFVCKNKKCLERSKVCTSDVTPTLVTSHLHL